MTLLDACVDAEREANAKEKDEDIFEDVVKYDGPEGATLKDAIEYSNKLGKSVEVTTKNGVTWKVFKFKHGHSLANTPQVQNYMKDAELVSVDTKLEE